MNKAINIQAAIEKATSEALLRPDITYNTEVRDLISSRPDMPKEAIQYFKKRVISRNPKVQLLTLELLDFTVCNTSLPFHTQVASKDFLATLSQLYRSRDVDSSVRLKLKDIITDWYQKFSDARDILPGFFELYNQLKLGGEEPKDTRPRSLILEKNENNKPLPPVKAEKLKKDLQVVRENISLTNEIISAGEKSDNETLVELVNTLKSMDGKLSKLIEKLEDMDMMQYTLGIKDDLVNTLKKYEDLKQGKSGKIQEINLLIDMPLETPPSRDQISNSLIQDLIFDPVPQNTVNNYNPSSSVLPKRIDEPSLVGSDLQIGNLSNIFGTNLSQGLIDPHNSFFGPQPTSFADPNSSLFSSQPLPYINPNNSLMSSFTSNSNTSIAAPQAYMNPNNSLASSSFFTTQSYSTTPPVPFNPQSYSTTPITPPVSFISQSYSNDPISPPNNTYNRSSFNYKPSDPGTIDSKFEYKPYTQPSGSKDPPQNSFNRGPNEKKSEFDELFDFKF